MEPDKNEVENPLVLAKDVNKFNPGVLGCKDWRMGFGVDYHKSTSENG